MKSRISSAIRNHPEIVVRQPCAGCKLAKRRLKYGEFCSRRCKSRSANTGLLVRGV